MIRTTSRRRRAVSSDGPHLSKEGARRHGGAQAALGVHASGISAFYGQAQAIFDVSMEARVGEITAIFGHNGAGKSTLLRCLAGLHKGYQGAITVMGRATDRLRPDEIAKHGVFLVREGSRVFESMSVDEHLELAARQGAKVGAKSATAAPGPDGVYDAIPLLAPFRKRQAGLLSGGQRQALSLGMSLAFDPQVLLIDEPSTGLAPSVAESIYEIIARIAQSGKTLIVAEQEPQWLFDIASARYILDVGRVLDADLPVG